mgnify:CR=1 FL=1
MCSGHQVDSASSGRSYFLAWRIRAAVCQRVCPSYSQCLPTHSVLPVKSLFSISPPQMLQIPESLSIENSQDPEACQASEWWRSLICRAAGLFAVLLEERGRRQASPGSSRSHRSDVLNARPRRPMLQGPWLCFKRLLRISLVSACTLFCLSSGHRPKSLSSCLHLLFQKEQA